MQDQGRGQGLGETGAREGKRSTVCERPPFPKSSPVEHSAVAVRVEESLGQLM